MILSAEFSQAYTHTLNRPEAEAEYLQCITQHPTEQLSQM